VRVEGRDESSPLDVLALPEGQVEQVGACRGHPEVALMLAQDALPNAVQRRGVDPDGLTADEDPERVRCPRHGHSDQSSQHLGGCATTP
jgi:hypothetical protein